MSFYKRFHQQEPMSNNLLFKNNSPKSLDRREIFSRDEPARGYPRVIPSRQVFDKSDLFVRNSRNKYSESLSEDKRMKNYEKVEEDPMSKVLVYHADRDTKSSWKNSRDTSSSNVMQSKRSFPKIEDIYRLHQEDILDEEKNAVKKYSNSSSQPEYSREKYNSIGFDPSEIKHDSYVKDTNIPKSTKEFFDKWDIAEVSSLSSNLGQFRNNVLKIYPAEKQEIIAKDDNKQINSNSYNSEFPQNLNVWESRKNGKLFDSLMRENTKPFKKEEDDEDMKEYFEDEPEYFVDDKDMKEYFEDEPEYFIDDKDMKEYFEDETEYFMDDKDDEDMKEYFEDETKQDTIETEQNYNPHILSQNNWKRIENEGLLDDLDFMRESSQETEQGLYSEENNKYFQDEDIIFRDKAYPNAETARAPIINAYNAYIVPRYLNVINDKKNQPTIKSETQKLLEAKNSIRANPVKKMDHKYFEDKAVTGDNIRVQDFVLPKDIFHMEEHSDSVVDKRNNIRNKNEALIELDPDLLDDIENPAIETTESTPT